MNFVKQNNSIFSDLLKTEQAIFSVLKVGDLVEGKMLEKGKKKLFLDLGKYGLGVVYGAEVSNAKNLLKDLNVGDTVHAKVVELDNDEGYIEVSLSEAGKQKAWTEVSELKEKGEILQVKISGFNKGGLTTELHEIPAFLPVSQLSTEHYPKVSDDDKAKIAEALQKLVGQELAVKIIDVNPRSNKLIISEKEAVEISSKELAKNYEVGQVVEAIVSGVADFGAFVRFTDNPAVEGLIHVSELDWRVVDNPKEIVKVDDVIKAKIIEIKDGKISLSLKALKADPWEKVKDKYRQGQEVIGKVYGFHAFGAIVDLGEEIQGQVHVTEFGSVEEMKKALALDKEYAFVIESIKPEEKRINLKLKK